MIAKTFEVRDVGTFIPVLAVKLCPANESDRYLLARAGYGTTPEMQSEYIQLLRFNGGSGNASCDPFHWGEGSRTMFIAHRFIISNFDTLVSGEVIDVEYILGDKLTKKRSEQYE